MKYFLVSSTVQAPWVSRLEQCETKVTVRTYVKILLICQNKYWRPVIMECRSNKLLLRFHFSVMIMGVNNPNNCIRFVKMQSLPPSDGGWSTYAHIEYLKGDVVIIANFNI